MALVQNSLNIVVPTYNEELNIKKLLQEIKLVSRMYKLEFNYEVIVVDDGNDATGFIAQNFGARVIKGQRKGLGQAIVDGINASDKDIVLVMDADLQHNPHDIPRLLEPIVKRGVDFVIGSKYVKGGDTSEWNWFRRLISTISGYFWYPFLGIKDANSGFFAFRKEILNGVKLKGDSWKVMLEVLVKGKWISKEEIPIKFGDREYGDSKNSLKQALLLSIHMIKLIFIKYRFLRFGLVGAMFSGFHFGLLFGLTEFANFHYLLSAICSGILTATLAYTINHRWTFERTKIRHGWLGGWLEYVSVCGVAELTYLGMLALFTEVFNIWYIISAMMAICINYPIKYMIVSRFVWSTKEKESCDSKDYEWRAFYRANTLRRKWKRKITENIANYINYRPAGQILDIGCGSSPTVTYLKHNHYVGIDANESKMNYMNDKNIPDCEFITGDENSLNFIENSTIDTILCIELIEHLKSPAEAIKLFADKLKMGGKLIIATPNNSSLLWHIIEKAQRILQPTYHTSKHVQLFSKLNIDKMCEWHGLTNIMSEYIAFNMDMILYYEKGEK